MAELPLQSRVKSPSTNQLSIEDTEFGTISCRRMASSKYIRVRLQPDGTLSATLPPRAPLHLVQQLVNDSRDELRKLVGTRVKKGLTYTSGMKIGASHTLTITSGSAVKPLAKIQGQSIHIVIPSSMPVEHADVQSAARQVVKKALMKEAKSYLPRRLRYLADTYGFSYVKVRFSNAKGRWGSCTSQGTISLNIALMRLDRQMIDYVLLHELSHTEHMNHSPAFWERLAEVFPHYKTVRLQLKHETPYL